MTPADRVREALESAAVFADQLEATNVSATLRAFLSTYSEREAFIEAAKEWNAARNAMSEIAYDPTTHLEEWGVLTARYNLAEKTMRVLYRALVAKELELEGGTEP